MTFYFVGGEDHDFTKIGACTVDTATAAARRTANARCALKVGPSAGSSDGWQGVLSSAVSELWFSGQFYTDGSTEANRDILSFLDGSVRRISLRLSTSTSFYQLVKRNAANTVTTLATSSINRTASTRQKIDVHVAFGVAGSIDVYLDGSLILSYSGDVTTDAATTLSGFVLGLFGTGSTTNTYWSEVIVADEDTRAMSVVTLPPSANGNTFTFDSGSYADVDETTLSDTDLITSATAAQLAQVTVSSSGITGTPAIRAICVSARAQKGGTGPQNVKMNVRTSGSDHVSTSKALPAAMGRVAHVFEDNPATSGNWGYADITAAGFNVGIQSEA